MPRPSASAVPGALVPTVASDQSAPGTNIMPSARRCMAGSPSTHSSRPTSSPTATSMPLSWLGRTRSLWITGMIAAKGCCRRYSSSSSRSMASGASGLSGFACNWAERCQDSRIRLRSPGSCSAPGNSDSSCSWPARAYCWRSSGLRPEPRGTACWTGFLIELPPGWHLHWCAAAYWKPPRPAKSSSGRRVWKRIAVRRGGLRFAGTPGFGFPVGPGLLAAGNLDHLLAGHNLDAFTHDAVGLAGGRPFRAEGQFVGVELVPAFPRGVFDAALFEQVDDGLRIGVLRRREGQAVLEQEADGLQRVALGVADQADRAALDPAGGVDSRYRIALGVEHPAALVGDDAA